jgi:predicted nicotinamide N-methyase
VTRGAPTALPAPLPAELVALDGRFDIVTTRVALPDGDVRLAHPRAADELIDATDFARDERLPYWADLWPSSLALARCLPSLVAPGAHGAPGTPPLRGRHAIELGCGLGLVTIAAIRAGLDVLATDYYADALLFTRRNALVATGTDPRTRLADWRAWPADAGRFDLVLAADVLYERAYAAIVAQVIAASLAPGGRAFVADPGRAAVPAFIACAHELGLSISERRRVHHHDGAIAQVITIHEMRAGAR